MIISHRYRFIFIKTLKTAGTSLEVHLSDICAPDDVLTPVWPPEAGHRPRNFRGLFDPIFALRHAGRNHVPTRRRTVKHFWQRMRFYNHIPAVLVRNRVPRAIWEGYTKFCVERDPVAKTRSMYRMMRERGQVRDLEDFFARRLFPLDWDRYSDFDGRPMVDRILRYEHLDADLSDLFATLVVPFEDGLTVRAKSAPARRETESVRFTSGQEDAIRTAFRRELDWRAGTPA